MARHQYGIFAEGTRAHHHLELSLRDGVGDAALAEALVAVRAANADHRTTGGVNLVIGLGPDAWDRVRAGRSASVIRPFPGYESADGAFRAPATQRDVWLWAHGSSTDVVYDVVRTAAKALEPVAELALDVTGFTYHDSRDLTGFVDGSANPFLDEAPELMVIPDGEPGEGGCCAMTMRFRHDLDAFHALDEHEQELAFGRTKRDSVELDDDVKPADAHIALAEVEGPEGEELEVYRRSVPWANASEQGLQFVSFGPDVDRFDRQLRALFGVDDPTLVDRFQRFTTALSGSFWFCPSVEDLDAVAPVPDDED
ncbi:Dyp-type peroxidase [Aquihabitans daechungensis]|uniref:Dyp-type peroxidase n=1 Tax=Aquihabitans daechungensis TaxID=1052257 RepID=UPI003BA2B748